MAHSGIHNESSNISSAALSDPGPAPRSDPSSETQGALDAASEAKKIAFDKIGSGEKVLLISGFSTNTSVLEQADSAFVSEI